MHVVKICGPEKGHLIGIQKRKAAKTQLHRFQCVNPKEPIFRLSVFWAFIFRNFTQPYTLAGFEPRIFCSGPRRQGQVISLTISWVNTITLFLGKKWVANSIERNSGNRATRWACERIAQNVAQNHYSSKFIHNLNRGEKGPNHLRHFWKFQITAKSKQPPNRRNFAQSGTDVMI
jgi:hypothetical protein